MKSSCICLALTAHVDAGKTTLSESILLNTGVIRKAGRVDHGDSFFDHEKEERERGITIFSKQALFTVGGQRFILMDTPGHVDFSAEMERVLSVLDYAVLIISAPDGLHGHDLTLWKLFKTWRIPVFLFINKMDQPGADREKVLRELESRFGSGFIDFTPGKSVEEQASFDEAVAVLDDGLTETYLESGKVLVADIRRLIRERKLFPCCFGSALKNDGVGSFLDVLAAYTECREYPESFSARVFKISRDSRGNRLTHLRVTGGVLRPKDTVRIYRPLLSGGADPGDDGTEEKTDQILLPNGGRTEQLQEVAAGMVVAVSGLKSTTAGGSLGKKIDGEQPMMVPLFSSRLIPPEDVDIHRLYLICRELEEEIPEISVDYEESSGELKCRLMGEVQTDVLKELIRSRYGIAVTFEPASVIYKETITAPVYCAGHYEPLRHYAEAHFVMEPAERGSGLIIDTSLSEDILPRHFQRLIMTNVSEKEHRGVLTGGELTDVRITLVNARAHEKHTEGGDFRQAVRRAVRQGLMKCRALGLCQLLEPYYEFELRVPIRDAGRAMTDLTRIAPGFEGPEMEAEEAVFRGNAPVSAMQGYDGAVLSYTGGFGHLTCVFSGYGDCRDQAAAVAAAHYDPELDPDNPSGSVFCSHGAGYFVPWDQTDAFLHLPMAVAGSAAAETKSVQAQASGGESTAGIQRGNADKNRDYLGQGLKNDKELEEIFNRTLGNNRKADKKDVNRDGWKDPARTRKPQETVQIREPLKQYLLVDGYNIIFAWDDLKELAAINIDAARAELTDILANYQGFRGMTLILVFDAYKVRGGQGSVEKYHNIYIVYTKEAQTADAYIEATVHEIGRKHRVTVATSDGLEQTIVFGEGAARMSARELREAVEECSRDIHERFTSRKERLENHISIEGGHTSGSGDKDER
ncbi:MAG: TetM/TetW/TetO/TetS family tetracycline resistance ribosomal protection protein [Lachnospiraceae bacterium]|nr:TetM/TetW/TetO/TetS family tetracycline resistance ribosomal protection protein [Lachnospiraceae bacterium]